MKRKGLLSSLFMMACCIVPMLALVAFLPQIKHPTNSAQNKHSQATINKANTCKEQTGWEQPGSP